MTLVVNVKPKFPFTGVMELNGGNSPLYSSIVVGLVVSNVCGIALYHCVQNTILHNMRIV